MNQNARPTEAFLKKLSLRSVTACIATMLFALGEVTCAAEPQHNATASTVEAELVRSDARTDDRSHHIAEIVKRLTLPDSALTVAWSPDGKLLATLSDLWRRITLWNPRTGEKIREMMRNAADGDALAFSDDGRFLLTATAKVDSSNEHTAVTLWNVANGAIAGTVAGPYPDRDRIANSAQSLVLDRSDALMAVITQHFPGALVGIYGTQDWRLEGSVAVDKDTPTVAAFGVAGMLAVGTIRGQIVLFDARTRSRIRTISANKSGIESLAFSSDGKYIVSGSGSQMGSRLQPDGKYAPVYPARPIQIWNASDGSLVRTISGIFSRVNALAWSRDGKYIASASFDGDIRIWSVASDDPPQIVAHFSGGGVWGVAFSPDGRWLAATGGKTAIIAGIASD